ncbi:hypothetical protein [Campylobacter iguaniorum]|nr:hypothetical protein [Campylobacter iguaniorum]
MPNIDTNRTLKSNSDISVFMLDVFEAYEKCKINLMEIKKINE